MIPEPFEFALIALAAARLWKLIGDDRILDRPRDWLLARLNEDRRTYWGDFLVCPWCAGFWVSWLVYTAWLAVLGDVSDAPADIAVGIGVVLAISALVGLFALAVDALQKLSE